MDTIYTSRKNTLSIKWDALGKLFGNPEALPLWVADMDFPSPLQLQQALEARSQHPFYGYVLRPDNYFESLRVWLKTYHNFDVPLSAFLHSPSVITSLAAAVECLTQPGEEVLIQPPVYGPFFKVIEKTGRKILENPLKIENNTYTINFEHLESLDTTNCRLMLFCSPHNPVGRVWRKEELERLAEFCIKRNIWVVSDEIHADLVYKDVKHIPFATIPNMQERTITCWSPSKTFNIPGLGVSALIVENREIRQKIASFFDAYNLFHANVFGTVAFLECYATCRTWLDTMIETLDTNRNLIDNFFKQHLPELTFYKPEGTYLGWIDAKALKFSTNTELIRFFSEKHGIALEYGKNFGHNYEHYMRINFALPQIHLQEALQRLKKGVEERLQQIQKT